MVLLLDIDMTAHVRWESEQLAEHHPLTPGEVRRLIREVLRNMKIYRRELEVLGRFTEQKAERPFKEKRYEAPRWPRELPAAPQEEIQEEEVTEITATVVSEPSKTLALGGESPLPDLEW
jgi:hypothetical protein